MMSIDGWEDSSLISLLRTMKSGGTPNTSRNDFYGGEIPFVAIEDMSLSRKYLNNTVKKITVKGLQNSNTWIVPENSILYSIYATLGLVRINKIPVTTNQAILSLIVNDNKIDQEYLYYWLEYIRDSVINLSSQTTQSNLSATIVKPFTVRHPENKEEQEKIAIALSTVDRAIEQTEAIIAKQQRIKTGLMQDLLTKGIDEHGNIRSEETHEFKDSFLGRIPEEWIVEEFGNRVIESAFGPRFPSTAYSDQGNFALLRTTDLDLKGNIFYEQMPIAKLSHKEFKKHILNKGDLLITRSGTCGIPSIFNDFYVPTIPGAFLIRFRLFEKRALPEYIQHYFNWEIGRQRLLDLAEGGVQKNLRGSSVNQILFAFPCIDEQNRIVEKINAVQTKIDSAMEVLEKIVEVKIGLMQDLLTGKVRVTPLLEPVESQP